MNKETQEIVGAWILIVSAAILMLTIAGAVTYTLFYDGCI